MKAIKLLAHEMKEELKDAERYAKLANEWKANDRSLADMYADLATEELHHADREHEQAARLIREHRAAGKETPAAMQAVWDWEHEQMIEEEAEIKILLNMYRE